MKKKKRNIYILIIVCLTICAIVGFVELSKRKKIETLKKEYTDILDESMSHVYEANDSKKYQLENVDYEVTDLKKASGKEYTVTVVVNCTSSNNSLDSIEKSLLAYAIEDYVPGGIDNEVTASTGDCITLRESDYKSKYYGQELLTVNINGEHVHGPEEWTRPKSDDKVKKCEVCGREFQQGTDDSWSISTTGMCEQCYKNFKTANEMLGK